MMKFVTGNMVRIKGYEPMGINDSDFSGKNGFFRCYEGDGVWVDVPGLGEHYTNEDWLEPSDHVHNVPATAGGCWYCETVDDNLDFSTEFDTNVHRACIEKTMTADADDLEALIFAREFAIEGAKEALEAYRANERAAEEAGMGDEEVD